MINAPAHKAGPIPRLLPSVAFTDEDGNRVSLAVEPCPDDDSYDGVRIERYGPDSCDFWLSFEEATALRDGLSMLLDARGVR